MIVNKKMYELLEKVSEITGFENGIHWFDRKEFDGYIDSHDLYNTITELYYQYNLFSEKLEDAIQDRGENYEPKKFDPYDEYGISESDFH